MRYEWPERIRLQFLRRRPSPIRAHTRIGEPRARDRPCTSAPPPGQAGDSFTQRIVLLQLPLHALGLHSTARLTAGTTVSLRPLPDATILTSLFTHIRIPSATTRSHPLILQLTFRNRTLATHYCYAVQFTHSLTLTSRCLAIILHACDGFDKRVSALFTLL